MTHLAEFHQIEGVVADRGLTLGDLMGVINEFFQKLGWYLSLPYLISSVFANNYYNLAFNAVLTFRMLYS